MYVGLSALVKVFPSMESSDKHGRARRGESLDTSGILLSDKNNLVSLGSGGRRGRASRRLLERFKSTREILHESMFSNRGIKF